MNENGLVRLLRDIDRPDLIGEGLTQQVANAIADNYPPPSTNGRSRATPTVEAQQLDKSWQRVDLGPALHGETVAVTPDLFRRDDSVRLFYRGRVNGVHGDSGDGKSMVIAAAAAQELDVGHPVTWIDFEDNEHVIIERLRMFGVTDEVIDERLHYHRPSAPFDDDAVTAIACEAVEHGVTLVVIDSLGEAFGLEGIDEDRDVQVGPWLRRVARVLADAGPGVALIDHSTKAKDNPLFPSGSKRKRAAITGASYLITAPNPLTREDGGKVALTCAKDRHGHHKRGEHVATFDLAFYPDGGASVKIWPPKPADEPDGVGELNAIARAAVRAAKTIGGGASLRELLEVMKVKARRDTKIAGIERAIRSGALRTEPGARNATLHFYVHDHETTDG
jgi:KaiC/GvpD/RAD55 family RecA-like ATPase